MTNTTTTNVSSDFCQNMNKEQYQSEEDLSERPGLFLDLSLMKHRKPTSKYNPPLNPEHTPHHLQKTGRTIIKSTILQSSTNPPSHNPNLNHFPLFFVNQKKQGG